MTVETFVPSQDVVTLTDSAIKHFESKLAKQPGKRSVVSGGEIMVTSAAQTLNSAV